MTNRSLISILFAIAALYEGLIGLVFLLAPVRVFHWAGVPPPNHFGYVRFPAALLVVFGVMFFQIARNPERSRNLIPYGMALKASYCIICFYYWLKEGIPNLWKPFAIADLLFLLLFAWAYRVRS
jgi:hypothetical protein